MGLHGYTATATFVMVCHFIVWIKSFWACHGKNHDINMPLDGLYFMIISQVQSLLNINVNA